MSLEQFLKEKKFGCFVDGKFLVSNKLAKETLVSPTTGKPWKELYLADETICHKGIEAASKAFPAWKSTPSPIRAKYLRVIGDIMLANRDVLANIMAMEMGKPVKEGVLEVDYAAGYFYWFAGEAERIYGMTIPSQFPNKELMIRYDAIGVCGTITPWNLPLAMAVRKIAAGLAAGCSFISKPSPESPVSLLALAEITRQANLPSGVFNVLIGPEELIGLAMLHSSTVRKLSFTGSTAVGRYLYEHSATTLKKLTLELGGHAPAIVFDDADLNLAVQGVLAAKFRNNGQTCVAANRVYVQVSIYDAFAKLLIAAIKKLRIGSPLDKETDISTVLHPASKQKVKEHVKDALTKGATCLLGEDDSYSPIVLSNLKPNMLILNEETFGPVIPLTQFKTYEEGIAFANASPYGLASYVFTKSLHQAQSAMRDLEFGIIGVNDGLPSTPQGSFGGVKQSGFGREGGPTGVYEYLIEKYSSIIF